MRVLLFQVRNPDDPMLLQERKCFVSKLEDVQSTLDISWGFHNIISHPEGYRDLLHGYDIVMVGGSGDYGCVGNASTWFQEFCRVLEDIVESDKPMFCSCFGHQALAVALGGEVDTDKSRAELGTLPVTLNDEGREDILFSTLESPFEAQFGHNDFVSRLPRDAINLAYTPLCAVQAYRLSGRRVYSTQFHPELSHLENRERADRYLRVYAPELTVPERLRELFRPSESASSLLPRFVEAVADGRL